MLPEAGAAELIFLAAVALIVVGPKDLPALLRKVGQFTAKMRGLAAEFRSSFDELARQSELDELRREVDALRTGAYAQPAHQEIQQHFDALHREFDAPPPPQLEEGAIIAGPDFGPPHVADAADAGANDAVQADWAGIDGVLAPHVGSSVGASSVELRTATPPQPHPEATQDAEHTG